MFEVSLIGDAEQSVQQATITQINLGRFDLAFAEILKPRGQLPDHEHARHEVEIACARWTR